MLINEAYFEASFSFLPNLHDPLQLPLSLTEIAVSFIKHPLGVQRLQMRLNIVDVWSLYHLKQVIILLRLLLNYVHHMHAFSNCMSIVATHVCHDEVGR